MRCAWIFFGLAAWASSNPQSWGDDSSSGRSLQGFVTVEDNFFCKSWLPAGNVRSSVDSQPRICTMCSVLPWARRATHEQICRLDVSNCSVLQPGGTCLITCREPYYGPSVVAQCPWDNSEQYGGGLVWDEPNCELICPPFPGGTPPGYENVDGEWRCSAGYTGEAVYTCTLDDDCKATPSLSGCTALVHCMAPFEVDLCMLNLTTCYMVMPGTTCELGCNSPPYAGTPTIAFCPDGNTDPFEPLNWSMPTCDPSCNARTPVPEGYRLDMDGTWSCADTHYGNPSAVCTVNDDCRAEWRATGCDRMHPCVAPADDLCRYNMSECLSVPPGGQCLIRCREPFVGGASLARCAENNVDPNKILDWSPPRPSCSLFICPEPEIVPAGYVRTAENWRCAPGYAGAAKAFCDMDAFCTASTVLSGCYRDAPCWPLAVDDCVMDASSCMGVQPGETCLVRCKAPYVGSPGVAKCPTDNIDPFAPVAWESQPVCSLTSCPEPRSIPASYTQVDGEWRCAPGFAGNPQVVCRHLSDCSPAPAELAGCGTPSPCLAPSVFACHVNMSDCGVVQPGQSCQVHCRYPFQGPPVEATCPGNNLDPSGLRWRPPVCEQFCPDPETAPEGYYRTGAGWACDLGWRGTARKICSMDELCRPQATQLIGCAKEVPCAALPQQAACGFDVSDCQNVPPGGFCEVRCRAPVFVGPPSRAFCQDFNTDPNRMLSWSGQQCEMTCPPAESRPGFMWDGSAWVCAEGWTGKVEVVCSMENCDVSPSTLVGCVQLQSCTVPEHDQCRYDFSNCGLEGPGDSCSVRCRAPYVGTPTMATCSGVNVQMQPLNWTAPDCECPDPDPIPEGYLKSQEGWHCAPGFRGKAVKACNSTRTCFARPHLWGCAKIQGCLPLELDNCEYDFSECTGVGSGGSCNINCNPPYVPMEGSSPGVARCPENNVNPEQMMTWTLPQCRLDCPEINPVPIAYERVNGSWVCAENFAGTVQVDCFLSTSCYAEPSLTGCKKEEGCFPIELDKCIYDTPSAECRGGTCTVGCKAPYSGAEAAGRCQLGNTIPNLWPNFRLPHCSLQNGCPDPLPIPVGYVKTATGWRCDEGWIGTVHVACALDQSCGQLPPILTGCEKIEPCKMPDVDMCIYDFADCGEGSVATGTECTIRCRLPYNGTVTRGFCPQANTDPDQVLIYSPPQCKLVDCLDPTPVPPGYVKLVGGIGWSCDDGYTGVVSGCCSFDDICKPRLLLRGCYPLSPCGMPSPDACEFDLNDCPVTPLGYSCNIRCKYPYEGPPTLANCSESAGAPMDRSLVLPAPRCDGEGDSGIIRIAQELYHVLPTCTCPDPFITPEGYEKNGTTWICSRGFAGTPELLCQDGDVCLVEPILRGCLPLQSCVPPILNAHDQCIFDISDCVRNPPRAGDTCDLTCREPYTGPFGYVGCPADNTAQNVSATWVDWAEPPHCTLDCPDPSDVPFGFIYIMPEGYMKDENDNWLCAPGFAGTVSFSCTFGPNCTLINQPVGCLPFATCAGLSLRTALENCSLDTILCEGIGPGVQCNIHCKSPYVGPPGQAICPYNNTDPTREVQWLFRPACYCPDTCEEEYGYLKIVEDPSIYFRRLDEGRELYHLGAADAAGPFKCAPGWLGNAVLECLVDGECMEDVKLTGCSEIKGCIAPTLARDAPVELIFNDSVIDEAPELHAQAVVAGSDPRAVVPWVPRAMDYVPEQCRYHAPDCGRLDHNKTCEVSCKPPMLPQSTKASCPALNTQEQRLVDWQKPDCVLGNCVDPSPLPEGMEKTHLGYRCALGYAGEITFRCEAASIEEDCGARAIAQGCMKMQSCIAPQWTDPCTYDFSECATVPTGGSCTVRCRFPFAGFSAVGSCPSTNTIVNRSVDWTPQVCISTACPIPQIMPEGYAIGRDGSFVCAPGYTGMVTTSCTHDPSRDCEPNNLAFRGCTPSRSCNTCLPPRTRPEGYAWHEGTWSCAPGYAGVVAERCDSCTAEVVLGGCAPLAPCLPPEVDTCMFDVTTCWNLPGGTSCEVPVRRPYVGPASSASCVAGNTNIAQEAVWYGSPDNATCPDPITPPPGYVKDEDEMWRCDPATHRGNAVLRCQAPERCLLAPELIGCRPLQPCGVLQVPDPCAYDAGGCDGTLPNEECNVTCRSPYAGENVGASCHPDNVQLGRPVQLLDGLPECQLVCPDPDETPVGYAKANGRWGCAEGFGGTAEISCVRFSSDPADCRVNVTLTGCLPLQPCTAPVVDQCSTYVPEDCRGLPAGSSCYIFCNLNFVMDERSQTYPRVTIDDEVVPNITQIAPAWLREGQRVPHGLAVCPDDNTAPQPPLLSPAPQCNMQCPYPTYVPPGYRDPLGFNQWRCMPGYIGFAELNCTLHPNCSVTSSLSGCHELVPCVLPEVEDPCPYEFDGVDNCTGLMGGEACEVECKAPYEGVSTFARCPFLNIDPQKSIEWTPPKCWYNCTDPSPVPVGYVRASEVYNLGYGDGDYFVCANGYAGQVVETCQIDKNCVAITQLSGCLPIVPCKMPDVDTCMIDLTECNGLLPGQFCFIGCHAPYALIGDRTFATCSATNTDPNAVIEWTEPVCDCSGPTTLPDGYGRTVQNSLTSYFCLDGYVGEAVANCSIPGDPCLSDTQFEGCIKTVACVVPTMDPCVVDTSDCGTEVAPGQTCVLTCFGDYLGNTTASCSQTNINPNGLEIPQDFQCECPDPAMIPTGYARTQTGWRCADLYIGQVSHTCSTRADCTLDVHLTGCEQLLPCESLESTCLYDASNCTDVMPGESCDIFCESPYVGTATVGSCPPGNTEPNRSLVWNPPICNHTVCPAPETSHSGFILATQWTCDTGFGGTAIESCPINMNDNCSSETRLTGCLPVVGCVKPSADECVYDTSDCDNLGPGEVCILRCATNYDGTPTGGVCLASNTNPNRLVEWSRPRCRLVCPDPVPMPRGYIRENVTNNLQCAPGWFGSASSYCTRLFPGCEIQTTLFGCSELFPCQSPDIDTCIYDIEPGLVLNGGESRTISCKRPYRGFESRAVCPANNLDPERLFTWLPGECFCPDPCPVPPGYFKTSPGYDNWVCAQGYSGTSELRCSYNRQCQEVPQLVGCTKALPCAPLNLTTFRCDVESPGCENLQPGQSCEVHCAVPYTGNSITALCPSDNDDVDNQPILLGELDCVLETCNATDEIPVGYVKTSMGWSCDDGYAGTPAVYCSFTPDGAIQGGRGCGHQIHPTGCLPKVPCVPPASLAGCKYDISNCGSVEPGGECILLCRRPFTGAGVFATCPNSNTDPMQEVVIRSGSFLDCGCPDPAIEFVPAGYVKDAQGSWVCGPGYAGTAEKRCERPDQCLEEPEFLGCLPLQPCVVPTDVDLCMFDLSQCQRVMPGDSCEIFCVPPYKQGKTQTASCRANNTDPLMPLEWTQDSCELAWEDCTDPLPMPVGYEKRSDGYHCAPGFVGVAEGSPKVHCGPWGDCGTQPELTGCFELEPCQPVHFVGEDNCMYDNSSCPLVFEPGAECQVRCKAPFVGTPGTASCGSQNIVWNGDYNWTSPGCGCPNPSVAPEGYFFNASGWFCDTSLNYTGTAELVCSQAGFCLPEPTLIGCQKNGPCVPPLLDECMYDASSCDGILTSQQCVITCRSPFLGTSTTAFCESPGGSVGLQYTEPDCQLDVCPDPDPTPEGYARVDGGWVCAFGFEGTPVKQCRHDSSCRPAPRLTGCQPIIRPCRLPNLDCRYDLSNCTGTVPGQYCEVRCRAPYVGKPKLAICAPGNETAQLRSEELVFSRPYCDLEVCPDPEPIPPGYERVGESFRCQPGYSGKPVWYCRDSGNCRHELQLRGCSNASQISIMVAELSEAPSQTFFAPCRAGQDCGEPLEAPEGYGQFLGQWRCDSGYLGSPSTTCTAKRSCSSTPTLSGCVPVETCLPIIADSCDIDVSDCRNVLGGKTCEIRCKEPFVGEPTIGTCPQGNIDPTAILTWERPTCELKCPRGLPIQDGYVKDSIQGWICAPDFAGDAMVTCNISTACQAQCFYTGCEPIEVCLNSRIEPALDGCIYNATGCDGLLPDRLCEIRCMPPYVGSHTVALCRATAPFINRTSVSDPVLDKTDPDCTCPDPVEHEGYIKVDGVWQCDEGFAGNAMKRCQRPAECIDEPELIGCLPRVPCRDPLPSGLTCPKVDVSNCSQVEGGGSCEVFCVPPYVGDVSIATCMEGNTNPNQMLEMAVDPCTLGCDDPLFLPEGYKKISDEGIGRWECDAEARYEGTANVFCELSETCNSTKRFHGCTPIVRPCLAPALDPCKFDVSDCANVPANGSCTIRCAGHYVGEQVAGHCPAGNTDDFGLVFDQPRCVIEDPDCPMPEDVPEGYKIENGQFVCADDYVGSYVLTRCGHDKNCNKALDPIGCKPTVNCAPLKIDPCERDNVNCWDVKAGGSCLIGCKPPYFGTPTTARCPEGNTDPNTPLEYQLTFCFCSDPPYTPPGYTKDMFGQWICAEGYAGTAVKQCRVGETCIADAELIGCEKLQPCASLQPTSCEQDVSSCANVAPGGTCVVSCRSPWANVITTLATCPDGNVDPLRNVDWTPPECELQCPRPPVIPQGFEWNSATFSAICQIGYLGPAVTNCTVDNTTCQVTTSISGCPRLQPCTLPDGDFCKVNITTCRNIMPGGSCAPPCIPPFELYSAPGRASCPEGNLDPATPLTWDQYPNCSVFECPDPSPVPAGYEFGIDQRSPAAIEAGVDRWYCSPGYVGLPIRVCDSNVTCGVMAFLSGCLPITSCRAPVVDTCRIDDSQCGSIRPGSRCILSCRAPFEGAPTVASCLASNTNPDGLLYRTPNCRLPTNFDPIPLDRGFASTYTGFNCSPGYAGPIQTLCRVQEGCRIFTYPDGCAPPVPCHVSEFEDMDGRPGYVAGNLTFGRSQLDETLNTGQGRGVDSYPPLRFTGKGIIYEEEVEAYNVYLVDECNETIGPILASTAPLDSANQILCCDEAVYNITIDSVRMPEKAMGVQSGTGLYGIAVRVLIRKPKTLELSEHWWVTRFMDRVDPITNAAPRSDQDLWLWLAIILMLRQT